MASSEPPPPEDRRSAPREEAYVAAQVTVDGRTRIAVLQDASATGVKLLTHTRIEVGERIGLSVQVQGEEALDLEGEVVRRDELKESTPWRFRLGVRIDEPSEELAAHAAEINRVQRAKKRRSE